MQTHFSSAFMFFALLLVFSSCEKKRQNIFSGTVTETITDTPLEGVNIEIEMKSVGNNGFVSGFETIGTATTDAEGKFSFFCEPAQALEFRLTYIKDGYHITTRKITPDDVVGTYTESVDLPREAYLSYHFINLPPNPDSDVFRYRVTGMADGCDVCCSNEYHSFYGQNDTVILCPVIAYDTLIVEFYTFLNGVSHQYTDQIIGVPSDTVEKTIRY